MSETVNNTLKKIGAASALAPDDIRPGQYICVLRERSDHSCFVEVDEQFVSREGRVRARCVEVPDASENQPLFVEAVCVPFVLARDASGKSRVVDTRRSELARLRRSFGEFAFVRLKPNESAP